MERVGIGKLPTPSYHSAGDSSLDMFARVCLVESEYCKMEKFFPSIYIIQSPIIYIPPPIEDSVALGLMNFTPIINSWVPVE